MRKIILAIDGPAGSGKSTTARLVAASLGYVYIDTGAMYRAITLQVLKSRIDLNDESRVVNEAKTCKLDIDSKEGNFRISLNGSDVTDSIRTEAVTRNVSLISSYPGVREIMVEKQRQIGARKGCVVDGRDVGTVVFPEADLKFFLVADIMERARRRQLELSSRGEVLPISQVAKELQERDSKDSTRASSPLKKAPDAIEIDDTNLTIREQVAKVLSYVEEISATKELVK